MIECFGYPKRRKDEKYEKDIGAVYHNSYVASAQRFRGGGFVYD